MLDQRRTGSADQPLAAVVHRPAAMDRSMQVLEYLVAMIAVIVAVALTFVR